MSIEINGSIDNYINTNTDLSQDKKVSDVGNKNNNKVDVNDYISNLTKKFSFLNSKTSMSGIPTTVNVSSDYLKKCANDPDEAQRLEENLSAIPDSIKYLSSRVGMAPGSPVVTYANISVDADGNFSCVSGSTNDPDGKIAKQNSKDKVQNYYEELCKKFPQININKNGGVIPGNANKATVNISQACLEKMANDPEFAAKIEWNLSGEEKANALIYSWAKRDGIEIYGKTVTYDADGNRESSYGMRTANTDNKGVGINTKKFQNKYKKEEENWLNTRKKEWEEKLKELREKNKEKYEELVEKIKDGSFDDKSGEFEFKIHGTDIDSIIKQIEEKYSAGFNLSSNISSYDIKV